MLLTLLQYRLGHFTLLPLLVGDCDADWLADLLAPLMAEDFLLLVSSDLSHYLLQHEAITRDGETLQAILAMKTDIATEQACGCHGLNGALLLARRLGLVPRLLIGRAVSQTDHHNKAGAPAFVA